MRCQIKSLFLEETTLGYQLLGLVVLSVVLMCIDHLTGWLDGARATTTTVVSPVVVIADMPHRSARGVTELFSTRDDLRERIVSLENELTMLRVKTEKMAALTAENNRLRDLLGSAAKLQDNVLVAELIGVDPDPDSQEVVIDKGSAEGVFIGQAVLDSSGLLGR